MTTVEILYYAGCPAYRRTRSRVLEALGQLGIKADLSMVLIRNLRDAGDRDFHGSPTVRVEGRDLDPAGLRTTPDVALVSRTFLWRGKKYDAPPLEMVVEFLRPLALRP